MKQASNDVFARATFARDQDWDIGAGDPLQLLANITHDRGFAEDNSLGRQLLSRSRSSVVGVRQQSHAITLFL